MKKPIVSFIGRIGVLLALCALAGHDVYARHLQPDEAISMMRTGAIRSASAAQLRLAYTQKSAASVSTVYVFDREGAPGFYVLAADDAVGNILLGYSHSGSFSADNMAPGMKWLLNAYSARVSCCAESASPVVSKAAPAGLQAVAPLLSTKWSQHEPYNDLCPTYGDGRAVTGCVATAMAQVMKKHRWPASGTGEFFYVSNGVEVSSDFSSHVYDWDNMLDIYYDEYYQPEGTPAQREAVARLMFDCGVAARTSYSPYGSSANTINAATGMLNYFNYDKSMQYLMREWYTDDDWMRLMHSQISQGLPVIYGGDSNEGYGHEFILDGYDGEGYFHFNWGWGGWDDGYFSLAFDVPAGEDIEYVNSQEVLVNILPDKGSSYVPLMALEGSLLTGATQYEAQFGDISFTTDGQYSGFYSYALCDVKYEFGVKNTLDDKVISLGTYQLSPYYGFWSLWARSADFPEGEYDVYMVYKSADTDWTPMRYNVNRCTGRLHFINDGTTITVCESDVVATHIALNAVELQLTEGDTFTLIATVYPENATDKTVTWSTSDAAVATVDADGNVTAVAPGTATITATCGSVSATCFVEVRKNDAIWSVSADGISIRVADGNICIEAPEDAQVAVYDVVGTLHYVGYGRIIPVAGNKLYIVVVGSMVFKVKA